DPGPIDNSANTKNRDFRSIDDGGCAIGAKDAVIIQSKGATGQLGRCALARASFGNHLVDFGGELSGREPFSMLDRWDDEAPVALRGETKIHAIEVHDLFTVIGFDNPRVHDRIAA